MKTIMLKYLQKLLVIIFITLLLGYFFSGFLGALFFFFSFCYASIEVVIRFLKS